MKLDVLPDSCTDSAWYAQGLQFTCTQCGNCCTGGPGYVWLTEQEVERMAEFLKLTVEETMANYCREIFGRISLKEARNARGEYDCEFLIDIPVESTGKDNVVQTRRGCSIYPVRPLQCRTWPFWDGILEQKENWDNATNRCHGMNRGRRYTREQIEALRDAKDWPVNPPTSAE